MVPRIRFNVQGRPLPKGTSPGIVGIWVHRRSCWWKNVKVKAC